MLFGRRKHAAPAAATPATPAPVAPQLSDEAIFAVVQQKLTEAFGDDGQWSVTRRTEAQPDAIFHEVFVHSLATAVTAGVSAARAALESGSGPLGLLRAPRTTPIAVEGDDDEPAALGWEPAPITRWADLKRPVTGPVAVVDGEDKAA